MTLTHILSPLDQFEIRDIVSIQVPFGGIALTNIGLYLALAGGLVFGLNYMADMDEKLVSNS